ncbi:LolA family protein [Reichenbachiella ulvae]|uniref:Outer membrane lipoprotein carrier protein LolA n=1 Tax=Reichenbachiella ulvae TaxID=2980104 RepID=A0ABT3CUM3_9BACT|nr:outer membrane lipoprotein carrier protein LolA [Reichenbachiella ulvae]MCV9387180.1 outer membrane lipoprotein carrier protein LolA [Reichenbachiella ulvae]
MKKRIYSLMLGLAIICLTVEVEAQDRVEKFLSRLEAFNAKTTSIVSDFDQEQEFSFLDETMEASGQFYFMKPGVMKWDQKSPEAYAFVIKSDEAYKMEGGKKKNIPLNSPQIAGFKRFLLTTMDGSILQSGDFDVNIGFANGVVEVDLLPTKKTMKRMFEKVSLKFDEESLLLKELVFFETETDFRRIQFSNHQLNTLTDATVFTE